MMHEKIYNVCPYCGSSDVVVNVDARISSCHIKNNKICLNDEYIKNPISELEYSISRAGIDDLSGHCNDCKEYFYVEAVDDKGVCFCKIDQKYFNV